MQIGLQLIRFDWPNSPASLRPTLTGIAQTTEAAGFSSLWVMDHFLTGGAADARGVTVSQVAAACRALSQVGVQHVIFNLPDAHTLTPLETIGRDLLPAVAGF